MNSSTLYTGIAIVAAIIVVGIIFFFPNYLSGFSATPPSTIPTLSDAGSAAPATDTTQPASNTTPPPAATNPNAVSINDLIVGTGSVAESGDQVDVQYVGKLADGTVFDASSAHTQVMQGCTKAGEFCFTLGAGQVIPGWDQGLIGMKVGGERTLVIPPSLGYGANAVGPIPANSTLTFDVKLVGLSKPGANGQPYAPTGAAAD